MLRVRDFDVAQLAHAPRGGLVAGVVRARGMIHRYQRIRSTLHDDRRRVLEETRELDRLDALAHAVGGRFHRPGQRGAGDDVAAFHQVAMADRAVEREIRIAGRG